MSVRKYSTKEKADAAAKKARAGGRKARVTKVVRYKVVTAKRKKSRKSKKSSKK